MNRSLCCAAPLAMAVLAGIPIRAGAQVTNGGFETGSFSGWTQSAFTDNYIGNPPTIQPVSPVSGGPNYSTYLAASTINNSLFVSIPTADTNAVVSSQATAFGGFGPGSSPAIAPFSGSFLAFIANETSALSGSNLQTLTGSSIKQTFTVPIGSTTLSAALRLLNNDNPANFVLNDDFGGIALLQGSTVLGEYDIDLDPASAANAHVTANLAAGGFFNSTPWENPSFNVAALGGQSVTLISYVINYGGDNAVESRLLVDGITTSVPEPTSVALLGIGSSTLLVRRRLRV